MSGRRSRLGGLPLLLRHASASRTAAVLVAVLIAVAVLAVALAPRAVTAMSTAELHARLADLPPVVRDLSGAAPLRLTRGADDPAPTSAAEALGAVEAAVDQIDDRRDAPLRAAVGRPDWYLLAPTASVEYPEDARVEVQQVFSLAIDLAWESRVRFVEGAAPTAWTGDDTDETPPAERPPIEIALAQGSAETAGVEVGDLLPFTPAPVLVTGLYEERDPDAGFWSHAPLLRQALLDAGGGGAPVATTTALLAPDSLLGLDGTFGLAQVVAWAPIDGDRMLYTDAGRIGEQIRRIEAVGDPMPGGETLRFGTGTDAEIEQVVTRVTAVSALLALTASAPLGVLLAVFALGVGSVIDRRRPALALASARGAGPLALRGAMLLEGLVLAVPGTVLAIVAAALLLPVPVGADAIVLPALLGAAPPVMFAAATGATALRTTRADLSPRARGRVRWIIEVAVAGVALLALFLLTRRGLVASADAVGIDPLLAATPLLLAVAVCLGVLRLYPFAMLWLQRRMRRRRGVIGLVGAARGVRDPALGFPAALALVVGVSVAVFAGVLSTTVDGALRTAALEEIGADLRVEAPTLDDDVLDEVRGLDGVAAVAGLQLSSRQEVGSRRGDLDVPIVFADTEALHLIRPDVPAGMSELRDGRIPVAVATDLAERVEDVGETVSGQPGVPVGTIRSGSLPGTPQAWVLVDVAFQRQLVERDPSPDRLLIGVDPGVDPATVAPLVRETVADAQRGSLREVVRVLDSATQLRDTQAAPTVAGLRIALLIAVLGAVLLAGLALVLGSITASSGRNRTVGVLRTLGLSGRQAGGLIAWELGPVVVTALLAGAGLGLVLPWIVTTALDLRPFVGGLVPPQPVVDPLVVLALLGGFLGVAVVAGAIAVAIGRRLVPAGTLKMGAE